LHHQQHKVRSVLGVGVGSLLLAEASDDVDEPAVVLDASLGTAGLLFLLLLSLDLRGLAADLTGTGERTVDLKSGTSRLSFDRL